MPDKEDKIQRELKELKSEVRQLRYTVIGLCAAIVVLGMLLFPQLAIAMLIVTALVLIALLISPASDFSTLYRLEIGDTAGWETCATAPRHSGKALPDNGLQ